jgi:hypothetical protein
LGSGRSYRGFNFFNPQDELLFQVIVRRVQHQRLSQPVPASLPSAAQQRSGLSSTETLAYSRADQESHPLLQVLLTALGRHVIALGLRWKNLVVIPQLSQTPAH